eukprot:TRINITY_DN1182_c2_g1_i1.p1 TRINITY_DN1182_c2_g1~~TRINITY_DN1182_c2_g1_i1.p1  ORF type:complete len:124 (+),score=9.69 TRINITY_DN1182_c2_g1_i1:3-374(+)
MTFIFPSGMLKAGLKLRPTRIVKKPDRSNRLLFSQVPSRKIQTFKTSKEIMDELGMVPCNLNEELTPEEIEIVKKECESGVSYEFDDEAWEKADCPEDESAFWKVYRNGILTDEKIPNFQSEL